MVTQQNRTQEYVPITDLIVDQKYQFRAALDPSVVENYAELIGEGFKFPNLICFDTAREDKKYVLVDGFQRLKGYEINDYRKVNIDIIKGNEDDAMMFALNANSGHGAAYTQEDKRKRARFCFGHPVMKKWSDNKTAKFLGVTQGFISNQRKLYNATRGIDGDKRIVEVESKDGRKYTIDSKKGSETKGNHGKGRNKPIIPDEQKIELPTDQSDLEQLGLTDIVLGEVESIVEVDEEISTAIKVILGETYQNSDRSIKVTFDNLDKLLDIEDRYDLVIFSGDIDWIMKNQILVTDNPNLILQGSTGEDINKFQDIQITANTFNLFLVEGKMIVTAYYCAKFLKLSDKVISSYDLYLSELIQPYVKNKGSVLFVDPNSSVTEVMSKLDRKFHVFYSENNSRKLYQELDCLELLEVQLALSSGNSDTEVF